MGKKVSVFAVIFQAVILKVPQCILNVMRVIGLYQKLNIYLIIGPNMLTGRNLLIELQEILGVQPILKMLFAT
ncbi:hypothetical protein BLL41_12575 [Bacillus sp. FMQ74]|nr:hypothetical protein BLL41_12575 [Bacillus sp. FMQ74]